MQMRRTAIRGAAAAIALIAGLVVGVPLGQASTADIIAPSDPENPQPDSGWQAGTCNTEPPETPECNVASPDAQFFETAAGHPPYGFTQFIVKHETEGALQKPVDELATVRVDLPVGLSVNPGATPQCPLATFEASPLACPPGSEVGKSILTASLLGVPTPFPEEPTVYNIVPPQGEPARFGFNLLGNNVYLKADVAWDGDYHEGFTIDVPETPFAKLPLFEGGVVLENRLVFKGRSGDGTFITTPSTCFGEATPGPFQQVYSTWLLASSITEEKDPAYQFPEDAQPPFESRIPPGRSPKDCSSIPFDPSIGVDPQTSQTDSPSGAAVQVNVPHLNETGGTEQESSHVRSASVTLPGGMGLNPSAANGLQACTDAQFGKGTRAPVACPAASKVGRVTINTPPLPEGPLTGDVFVGQQLSRDPASGQLYRIFVDAESPRYGISARLIGNVAANPQTGQLTTTFDEKALGKVPLPGLPQVPFSSFALDFNDGSKAPLTSPPTCGPNATATRMTPWSTAVGPVPPGGEEGPSGAPPATPSHEFGLTNAPGGGACAKAMAERPFSPSFKARTIKPQGGEFSPLVVDVGRSDGNQELKGVNVKLPPGVSAKLAGVRYCPQSAIAAATANSGVAEAADPSCPKSSLVGTAFIRSGTGPEPIQIQGKAFLAGPYNGAPLSLVVVTPATAGPYDVGVVVVRVALRVDPETARVHAVPDPIPHVFGGALLDIRSISLRVNRPRFSLNPTNCSPMAIGATLRGGGANPLDPAAFSAFPATVPFQVNGCERLRFRPKLHFRVFGATKRGKNPRLRAVLKARKGDANIGRAAVTLPRSFFLDQASLSKVCTRVQFAANDCPRNSIYGHAKAVTPLLDGRLKGPVHLRSSDNLLPDLVARLRGQVEIHLVGRIDTVKGRIRTTFDTVPDVPVSKFFLTMRGGKKGLLVNSRNLCKRAKGKKGKGAPKIRAIARFKAHNGKKRNMRPKLRTPCGKKKGRGGKRRR
jgi:hypothetical protein